MESGRIGNVASDATMVESARRQRAIVTGGASTVGDDPDYLRKYQVPEQKYVLLNMANTELFPRSVRPAFRILGMFASIEEAKVHSDTVTECDPFSANRIITADEWYLIPQSVQTPMPAQTEKMNRNLQRHLNLLDEESDEFKKRKEHLTKGRKPVFAGAEARAEESVLKRLEHKEKISSATTEEEIEAIKQQEIADANNLLNNYSDEAKEAYNSIHTKEEAIKENPDVLYVEKPLVAPVDVETLDANFDEEVKALNGTPVKQLNITCILPDQRFCVVLICDDYESNVEPGIAVLAAFETEEEAKKYNKCVASKIITKFDLCIVKMYSWCYTHLYKSEQIEQLYRNEELNNIMRHKRNSKKRVDDFTKDCIDKNMPVPTIEVPGDLTEAAPIIYKPPVGFEDDHGVAEEKNGSN